MKHLTVLLVISGLLFAFAPTENKTHDERAVKGENVTVTGVLVDTKCYGEMPEENKGNDHVVPKDGQMMTIPNCATACANMGIPAALATDDGKTLTIIAPAGQLAEHMEKETRITGNIAFDGGLIPEKVEVRDGRRWVKVPISFMM